MKKVCILKRCENTEVENNYYIKAIKKYGGNPILIDESNINRLGECLGILLTGGFNKGSLDDYLIEYALKNNLPLLGICQGMQSMAIFKSNLKLEEVSNHHQKDIYVHEVILTDSNLKKILGKDKIRVNSYHYQTVRDSNYFSIVGRSNDGLIEVVENKNHPFQIGVQWHPERMLEYDDDSNTIFQAFINNIK